MSTADGEIKTTNIARNQNTDIYRKIHTNKHVDEARKETIHQNVETREPVKSEWAPSELCKKKVA